LRVVVLIASAEIFDSEDDGRAVEAFERFGLGEGRIKFAEGAGVMAIWKLAAV